MPMPHLAAAALLDLWQAAEPRPRVERSLVLAAAVGGGAGAEELARLPLGRRDERLVTLHAELGGTAFDATARCPACGEVAEFAVEGEALLARAATPAPAAPVATGGFFVSWRSPDSEDVAAAAEAGDAAAAERVLLRRCVLSATGPEGEVDATVLPAEVRADVERAMAEADPLAEVLVDVSCPACGHSFAADLDVAGFVWSELRAHARRLLREVDALARAYGWTEAEVLALDERRRAAYLELALEGAA